MSRDLRDIEPAVGLVVGGALFLSGLWITLIALGWIEVDPANIHAPRWVLGVCGAIFALPGIAALYYGTLNGLGLGRRAAGEQKAFPVVGWLLGLLASVGLAVVVSWVAFGPGERTFSQSVGVGGVAVSSQESSDGLGRLVFGFGAGLMWLVTAWMLIDGFRRITSGRRAGRP